MCSITKASSTEKESRKSSPIDLSAISVALVVVGILWSTCVEHKILTLASLVKACGIVLSFLVSTAWFVNFYVGGKLRQSLPLTKHLAAMSKKSAPAQCIVDLDKIANPEGLSQMWKDEVLKKGETFNILLTGVTGYVGRAFLYQLLREIANNETSSETKIHHKVYVMARPMQRKNLTAADRLEKLRDDPMFAPYKKQWDEVVVAAESGDLQALNCGMNQDVLDMLSAAKITHVVHCAADVNFNRPLADSAAINISPALQLQALAQQWPTCKRFVHCSTAFVNPGHGSEEEPMAEKLFSLGDFDPQQLYDSMIGDQKLAMEAKKKMAFPNNYVFTKCVGEHLVARNNKHMELKIVRPAIVGPAWALPEPGWNGEKPSTITALLLLWGTRVIRFAPLTKKPIPMVPVDVVAVGIIHAMIAPPVNKEETGGPETRKTPEPPISIRNLIWSHQSPRSCIDGIAMAYECIPGAVMKHHFSATETALSFLLIDIVYAIPQAFPVLHLIFNLGPLYILQFVCWVVKICGIKSVLEQVPVVKLLRFSDMLSLYKPYMGREYYFESSLEVPESMDMHQYCASLFAATHSFWVSLFPGTIEDLSEIELLPRGRLDLWWALTSPSRTISNRIVAYLSCKILRETLGSAVVDVDSMEHVGSVMMELEDSLSAKPKSKHCVILASTHQSPLDDVLAKYVGFSMSGVGTDVPISIADSDFADPQFETLDQIKSKFDRHATLAANLQESKASALFLRTLVNSPGGHDYTVIPLCMEYKDKSGQGTKQTNQAPKELGLTDILSLYWQVCVKGRYSQSYKGVSISYGKPTKVDRASDFSSVVSHVQREHCRLMSISDVHLVAAEADLKIPTKTLKEAAPYLNETHPDWARYMVGGKLDASTAPAPRNGEIDAVLRAICSLFDSADYLAIRAMVSLHQKDAVNPTVADVVKEMEALDSGLKESASSFVFEAAASFAVQKCLSAYGTDGAEDEKKEFQ